jgi:hypothetical protein
LLPLSVVQAVILTSRWPVVASLTTLPLAKTATGLENSSWALVDKGSKGSLKQT